MALRDPAAEYREKLEAATARREVERQRAGKLAAEVLSTEAGKELFEYLSRRYHLAGRSFLTPDAKGPACPYAAAQRDGEKAILWELVRMARLADPDFQIQIQTS